MGNRIPRTLSRVLHIAGWVLLTGFAAYYGQHSRNQNERADELEDRLERLTRAHEAPDDSLLLANLLARKLDSMGVPYARRWAALAVVETGWTFREGVGSVNNLFGMRCSSRAECRSCTANGYGVYDSQLGACMDLSEWIHYDAPEPGEDFESFLRRRGYNPHPEYYDYLPKIKF